MAELLFKANSTENSDPSKDLRGCYKRGDIVSCKPDGWSNGANWKGSCYNPSKGKFVVIKVPGVSVDQFIHMTEEWKYNLIQTIVSEEKGKDIITAKITNSTASTPGKNKVNSNAVIPLLESWGIKETLIVGEHVQFNFKASDVLKSDKFWGNKNTTTNLNSYAYKYIATAEVAEVTVKIDSVNQLKIKKRLVNCGAVLDSGNKKDEEYKFSISKENLFNVFKNDISHKMERTYKRRKFYISDKYLGDIVEKNGIITLSMNGFLSKIKNCMDE